MDLQFSEAEQAFIEEVQAFLDHEAAHPDAQDFMNTRREADSQLADSPARRAFNKRMAAKGYLGMSWPVEYGGKALPGIYEYLLNEELASRGAPQIGKGVGCVGKTIIRHGSERLKREFLPQILNAEIEFALGYSEPSSGSDLASLKLRATRDGDHWVLNGQKTFTTSAHFADWYWVAARTDPSLPKHKGISLFLVPMNDPGLTVQPIETVGGHRTNQVFFDDVRVHQDYLVGELNRGWTYICEALDYERFTLYTIKPLLNKFAALVDTIKAAGQAGSDKVRRALAHLAGEVELAKMLQRRVVAAAAKGGVPAIEAAMFKLYSTQLAQRLADSAMELLGPMSLLAHGVEGAPDDGRWEHSYRATLVDTIGGGSSEIQKNIIARRGLGLPLEN